MTDQYPQLRYREQADLEGINPELVQDLLTVTGNIAGTAWISILQPGPSNVAILLVDLQFNILQHPLSLVGNL